METGRRMALEAGKRPSSLSIPRWVLGREAFPIHNPEHADHDLYLELKRWAEVEGLDIEIDQNVMSGDVPVLRLVTAGAAKSKMK
jgi:hypothetical protein